jgi:hypothetical protein
MDGIRRDRKNWFYSYDMIFEQPISGNSKIIYLYHCKLAAAHKLANDYELPIPLWALKSDYIMSSPVYAFDAEEEYHEFLREITPDEYKCRNLFLGAKLLTEVLMGVVHEQ